MNKECKPKVVTKHFYGLSYVLEEPTHEWEYRSQIERRCIMCGRCEMKYSSEHNFWVRAVDWGTIYDRIVD